MVSRQVKSQLGLGFTPEQMAGRMKLESYNGAMGYQTIYRLYPLLTPYAFHAGAWEQENLVIPAKAGIHVG